MRESFSRHFDVVVVVWVLALAVGFSIVTISKAQVSGDWSTQPQSGPVWNAYAGAGN
jgi:hypothetical protein